MLKYENVITDVPLTINVPVVVKGMETVMNI